jgi:hypothetical protein
MADLQVVYLQDVITVHKVEPVDSLDIAAVKVVGKKMDSAATVLINNIESPSFFIVSKSELIAEIPSIVVQSDDIIRSVAVLAAKATNTERAVINFRLGGHLTKVSGIQRLIQRYILMLLTSPGSDLFDPDIGGGLQDLIGKVASRPASEHEVSGSVARSVNKATEDLQRLQSGSQFLDPSERLVSADIIGTFFDPRTTVLAVQVQLNSAAGRAAVANLVL